jgi:hypothetical protein
MFKAKTFSGTTDEEKQALQQLEIKLARRKAIEMAIDTIANEITNLQQKISEHSKILEPIIQKNAMNFKENSFYKKFISELNETYSYIHDNHVPQLENMKLNLETIQREISQLAERLNVDITDGKEINTQTITYSCK